MLLTLNIGNTNTQLAYWEDHGLAQILEYPTSEITAKRIPNNIPIAAACVVPEIRKKLSSRDIFWLVARSKHR